MQIPLHADTVGLGNYNSGLESLIVSHARDEVSTNGRAPFIPPPIKNDPCNASRFDDFLSSFIPQSGLAYLRQNVSNEYPSQNYKDSQCPQGDQEARVANVIRDAVFTCNTRLLYDAYQGNSNIPTYMMQYSLFHMENQAVHASDLLPTFWNSEVDYANSLPACFGIGKLAAIAIALTLKAFAPPYQSYFASHAVTGDPNTNAIGKAKAHTWQVASVDAQGNLTEVVDAVGIGALFNDITDGTNSASTCGFWKGIAAVIQTWSDGQGGSGLVVQDSSVRGSSEL